MIAWARRLSDRPSCIPQGRPRGRKAFGIRYERALGEMLGSAWERGVWFEYLDHGGARKFCQVDFLGLLGHQPFVLEAKYTWVPEAWPKLRSIYLPVVTLALGRPATGAVVCRNLVPGRPPREVSCGDLEGARELALDGWHPVVHWLGPSVGLAPSSRRPGHGSARGLALADLGL